MEKPIQESEQEKMYSEIKVKLSPEVVKFLSYHLKKGKNGFYISNNKPIARKIINLVRKAPNGYKNPDDYNFTFIITTTKTLRENMAVDLRTHNAYIPKLGIEHIDRVFMKFIKRHMCFWLYQASLLEENKNKLEQELVQEYKNIYQFTEDEFPYEIFHMQYWRFKKEFQNPTNFLLKLIENMYGNNKINF